MHKILKFVNMKSENKTHKYGLVLEGGAMRGLFSAGVMDVMMENGIEYDGAIGVSAGACFGCNYKSRQPGRVLRYNLKYGRDPRYMGFRTLLRTGDLVGAEFAYHTLPAKLDVFDAETFDNSPMEFIIVTTDVHTGAPVYYNMDKVTYESLEWMRASASMPVVTKPVKVDDGREMLDGGISDSIPLKYFYERGYDKCVVVLTQPRSYFKKPAPRRLFNFALRRYPAVAKAMAVRHEMYNAQLKYVAEMEQQGNVLIIAPEEPLPIKRVDSNPDKMRRVYEMGRSLATELLPQIKKFLDQD